MTAACRNMNALLVLLCRSALEPLEFDECISFFDLSQALASALCLGKALRVTEIFVLFLPSLGLLKKCRS